MNLYISDLHFGHKNAIRFDQRPFADTDEMDQVMIELWNSRVSKDDDVYILGDFCYKSGKTPDWYLRQLKGHKHLIVGNHDRDLLACENALKYLESVDKMLHVTDGDKQICLCHYPIGDWYKSHHGTWHIYGHIHATKDDVYQLMKSKERALNAAACINHYTPSSVNELIRNNRAFQEKDKDAADLLFSVKDKVSGEKFLFELTDLTVDEDRNIVFGSTGMIFAVCGGDGCMLNSDLEIGMARKEDQNYPYLCGRQPG